MRIGGSGVTNTSYVSIKGLQIPVITPNQMRKIDRLAVEKYGIQIIQMMENAGKNLADLVRKLLGNSVLGKSLVVAAGKGNNGGGGMAAARHLYNWGAKVTLLLPTEPLSGVSEIQRNIIQKLPIEKKTGEAAFEYLSAWKGQMILDAMIGYGLSGKPQGWVTSMIEEINRTKVPVVALDVPTGFDGTTGECFDPCIRATATMTIALPKTGLVKPETRDVIGTLFLCDIGIPNVLYEEIGIKAGPIFIQDSVINLSQIQERNQYERI